LTKVSGERKANMQQIKVVDEQTILAGAIGFLGTRFNAKVMIYKEDDTERFDPKNRASMAMPYQPAIYLE
jgi:hypothetical protein